MVVYIIYFYLIVNIFYKFIIIKLLSNVIKKKIKIKGWDIVK